MAGWQIRFTTSATSSRCAAHRKNSALCQPKETGWKSSSKQISDRSTFTLCSYDLSSYQFLSFLSPFCCHLSTHFIDFILMLIPVGASNCFERNCPTICNYLTGLLRVITRSASSSFPSSHRDRCGVISSQGFGRIWTLMVPIECG